jgi:dipeptidyl aminopeptidase/acylaminoacyl peptidase
VTKLVFNLEVEPHWIGETDRFWYLRKTTAGKEFLIVDPAKNSREPAFDHGKLATALSAAAGKTYESNQLPFDKFEVTEGGKAVQFDNEKAHWKCGVVSYGCQKMDDAAFPHPGELASPDKKWAAFLRDHNLYVRSLSSKQEIQLTRDGEPFDDYGMSPECDLSTITRRIQTPNVTPIHAVWSPDSKKLVTYRLDQTKVKESYLIQSVAPGPIGTVRPVLYSFRIAYPGDKDLPLAKYSVFDVQANKQVALGLAPQQMTYLPPSDFGWIWWDKNGTQVYFVETDRWSKTLKLDVADAVTGATRTIIEEHSDTETDPGVGDTPSVRVLGGNAETIWFSQRDGWGHLYLYDAATGKLLGRITSGSWVVRDINYVDESGRWVYFSGSGREAGEDPYLRNLYRVKLDGSDLQVLTSENADHSIAFSPSGRYFVDVYSRVDAIPHSVLRSADGKVIRELERADFQQLLAKGWKFPEPFVAKAADGVTDIYGVIFRPSNFDPSKKYPILDSDYPGPQISRAPKALSDPANSANAIFSAFDPLGLAPATAELGFVVVTVDGRGTPFRSKAFQDYSYKRLGDAGGLEDHVAAIKQLAVRYPYLDLDRVGMYGHSGGGYATVRAMLTYPDFYKVGVASSGEHDMRDYISDWGEKYQGPLGSSDYNEASNPLLALNADLKGRLLIAWGDMDDNVPPALQLQLIHSLILRNEDFDTLVLPNRNHSLRNDPYFIRRRWDYLVENLLGADPPRGYKIKSSDPTYHTLDPPKGKAD